MFLFDVNTNKYPMGFDTSLSGVLHLTRCEHYFEHQNNKTLDVFMKLLKCFDVNRDVYWLRVYSRKKTQQINPIVRDAKQSIVT